MRRVLYSVAASLDGFIAGPDGEYDRIPMDPAIDMAAFMDRFDTLLMGRRTYEILAAQPAEAPRPQMPTYVFSTTLRAAEHPEVTVVGEDAAREVRELRAAPGKDIWLMGGGVLFASLLEADLVDGVEVAVIPILLGGGLPLLTPMPRQTRLKLLESRAYPSGIVLLSYEVEQEPAAGPGRRR